MKIKIKYKEKHLDLFRSTAIQLELNNPIYYDATGELSGAYSFPFDIPASNLNRSLFDFLDLAQSKASFQSSQKAMIEFEGISLFEGTLVCINASKDKFKIKIVVSPLYDFKNIKVNELKYADFYLGNDAASREWQLNDSLQNPLRYNWATLPVYNNGFDGLKDPKTIFWDSLFQNPYFYTNQKLYQHEYQTPFARLKPLVDKVFEDFKFKNLLFDNEELKLLYLYNNYTIAGKSSSYDSDESFNLANHLPEISIAEFIKSLQMFFCAGLFKHFSKNEIKLVAMKDMLKSTPTVDWTKRISKESNLEPIENKIGVFEFEKSGVDALEHDYVEESIVYTVGKSESILVHDKATWINNIALIYKDDKVIRVESKKEFEDKKNTLSSKMNRLEMLDYGYYYTEPDTGNLTEQPNIPYPACYVPGSRFDIEKRPKMPLKLMLYRGMIGDDGYKMPLTSNNNYGIDGADTYNYSLNWEGEKGLYNTFHKEWHRITADGKLLSCQINLTTTELYNVDMSEVIHISGSNYVIKNLKVNLTSEGLKPISAQLVKIL